MNRKAFSGIMLTLLFIGMLTLAFNIQSVKSHPTTWTVDDDGPADFQTIQEAINAASAGDIIYVYNGTYNENLYIQRPGVKIVGENLNNTIIDGRYGETVWGYWNVITISQDATYITICNFTIQNSGPMYTSSGIYAYQPVGHNISNNIITSNHYGILLLSHTLGLGDNIITKNIVSNNTNTGISIYQSDRNEIDANIITSNRYGIHLIGGSGNILTDNIMHHNEWDFGVSRKFNHDIDASNTVNGKPVYYWVNEANKQVPKDAGYVAIINSANITVKNLNLTNNFQGVLFAYTKSSTIENVNISNNLDGIFLYSSSNNSISCNTLSENYDGVLIWLHSEDNTIVGNTITSSKMNTVSFALRVYHSNDNVIYHNNFLHSHNLVENIESNNTWDNGYPSGGNYWSDYTGEDRCRGPYQNETGSDGIGDIPYPIDGDNQDNYPLMHPWIPEPGEAIDDLITTIGPWNLPKGVETSLTSLLEDAARLLEEGRENASIHVLNAFIRLVQAHHRRNILTDQQADQLITTTQAIKLAIKAP